MDQSFFQIVLVLLIIGVILLLSGFFLYLAIRDKKSIENIELPLKLLVWGVGVLLASGLVCGLMISIK